MCIAMFHKAGEVIPDNYLDNNEVNHPHGGGIAYITTTNKLKIWKTLDCGRIKGKYHELRKQYPNSPMIVHYRKCTSGVISIENTHPFFIDENTVFAHNKTIYKTSPTEDDRPGVSDTVLFNERILQQLPEGWMVSKAISNLIEEYIANSRIVVMNNLGEYTIYGEFKKATNGGDAAGWEDGVWYSNPSYKYKSPPKPTGDAVAVPLKRCIGKLWGDIIWHEDGLLLKYDNSTKEVKAFDPDNEFWKVYECNSGTFKYGVVKSHRPAAHKVPVVTSPQVVVRKPLFQSANQKCGVCGTDFKCNELTLIRVRDKNKLACPSCIKFYQQAGERVDFLGC